MKIAIISDIHANLDALNSVLEHIKNINCTHIFCLGDIVLAGPYPIETLSKIITLSKNQNFQIIQGNTDKMLSVFSFDTYNNLLNKNKVMAAAYLSDSQLFSQEDKNFLANLPEQKEIELFGIKILLVHGSPRKNDENIYPNLPIEQVEEMIKDTNADVIFCGHTHMPCGYQTNNNKTVVNVGSIGRPIASSYESCFAVLDINEQNSSFEIHHEFVPYNVKNASEQIKKRNFAGADKLANMLLNPSSRYP